VQRSGWCRAGKLLNGNCDPAPGIGAVVIAIRRELVDAGAALLERFVAVAFGLRLNGASHPGLCLVKDQQMPPSRLI